MTRIKAYRGTDLVDLAVTDNRSDILYKEYDKKGSNQDNNARGENNINKDASKLEMMVFNLLQTLEKFIQVSTGGSKGKDNVK